MVPKDPKHQPEDAVVGQAREDVEPFTQHGVAPEARADRVPPDVTSGASRPVDPGDRADRRLARGPAVPGVGGGQAVPEEVGETPTVHLEPALATEPPTPEVGKRPVPSPPKQDE